MIARVHYGLLNVNHVSQYDSIQIAYHEIPQIMKSSNSHQFNYTNRVE